MLAVRALWVLAAAPQQPGAAGEAASGAAGASSSSAAAAPGALLQSTALFARCVRRSGIAEGLRGKSLHWV